jgi:hypothetical protein
LLRCTWLLRQSLFPYWHDTPTDRSRSEIKKEQSRCRNT